jgi:hypothetical protein
MNLYNMSVAKINIYFHKLQGTQYRVILGNKYSYCEREYYSSLLIKIEE